MTITHPTKNDLPAATRERMAELLNANLANAIELSLRAKHAHWNVKGGHFAPLHELFDEVYEQSAGWVDLLAERAVQLGAVAEGTLRQVAQRSKLPDYANKDNQGRSHVDALSTSLASFGTAIRQAISAAESDSDAGTADLFTEVSRASDKMLWMLEAHLQND